MFPTHEKYPFSVSETHFSLKLYDVSFVILLQHPFQVRSLVEYLSCKLHVRDNLPVSVVLQGTGTDVQSLAHFLAREEKFAIKEWFVRLCYFHNPFPHTSQCRDDQLHLVRLHVQVPCCFHHICLFLDLFDFVRSNASTSSRL